MFSFSLFFLVVLRLPSFQILISAFVQPALKSLPWPCVLYLVLLFSFIHLQIVSFLLSLSNHFLLLLSFLVSEFLSFNFWNLIQWLPVLLAPFICGSQFSSLCLTETASLPTSPSRHRYLPSSPLPSSLVLTELSAIYYSLFFPESNSCLCLASFSKLPASTTDAFLPCHFKCPDVVQLTAAGSCSHKDNGGWSAVLYR